MSKLEENQELGQNFPVSDTIRSNIVDARTISKTGAWWTAVLLFEDSESANITLYKWKRKRGDWKRASSFKINSSDHLQKIIKTLEEFHEPMAT